jgi:RsiW-degrading membrane proteinase PrsW (M82 family)
MSVLKLPLFADLQQKVGELVLSITSCLQSLFYKMLERCVQKKNVVMVTLITGIMFLLFTCMHFAWGILRRWSTCAPSACKAVRIAESLRNTALETIFTADGTNS